MELSVPEQQTTFIFTDAVSTEVTTPPEHTHLIVNAMATTVTLPSFTTLTEASGSTSATLQVPATTTAVEIGLETFVFTASPVTIYKEDNIRFCGTYNLQMLTDHPKARFGDPSIVETILTIALPSSVGDLC